MKKREGLVPVSGLLQGMDEALDFPMHPSDDTPKTEDLSELLLDLVSTDLPTPEFSSRPVEPLEMGFKAGRADLPTFKPAPAIEMPDAPSFDTGPRGAAPAQVEDILARISAQIDARLPDWASVPVFELVEHVHTCACVGCNADRTEPTEAGDAITGEATGSVGILSDMADFLLRGYWNTGYGDGSRAHNVTSSGHDANNGVLHYNLSGYSADGDGVTAARATLIREAFKIFESTLGIEFVETTSTNTGIVDFFFRDNDGGAYASSTYWNTGPWGSTIGYAQINVSQSWSGGTSTYDDYTFQTILHEIGHALGLGHQGPYNGSATYGTHNIFDNDNWQSSMMSYFSQKQATAVNASYEFLQTPMVVDWLALDEIYGRQGFGVSNAYTENTTWGFNTTVTSDVSDVWASWSQWAHRTASTIVDGGGIDTLDLSGYANNTLINLAPSDPGSSAPSSSNIGGRIGNLTIASGTIIENAIGGNGSETFYGNAADNSFVGNGGDDRFHDSAGNDTYNGGAGNDFVLFGSAFADYTVSVVNGVLQVVNAATDWVQSTVEWLTFSDQTLSWQAVADSVSVITNTAPVARADSFSVNEDQILNGSGILANDTDANNDALTVASVQGAAVNAGGTTVTLASGATVTMFQNGTFEYNQNGAFDSLEVGQQATDTFTYRATDGTAQSANATVSIVIDGAFDNSGPQARNDSYRLQENGVVTGSVLANDTDANGDTLTVTALNNAPAQIGATQTLSSGATVILNADGTFTYDTNGAFDSLETGQTATDTFTYAVNDGNGGTDTARVTMTIDGDSPADVTNNALIDFENSAAGAYSGEYGLFFSGLDVVSTTKISGAHAGTSGTDAVFSITATGEDFDLKALSLVSMSGKRKVEVQAYDDGVLVGAAKTSVGSKNPRKMEFDASFDSIDQIVIKGAAEFLVDDISIATAASPIPGTNSAPVAADDALSTVETSSILGNLLSNDTDPDGDALSLVSINGVLSGPVTLASGAIVTFAANGEVTYNPNGAFDYLYDGQSANDSFTYTVSDGKGGMASATASVTIAGDGTPTSSNTVVDFETALQTSATTVTDNGFIFSDAVVTGGKKFNISGDFSLRSDANSITVNALDGEAFDFEAATVNLLGRGTLTLSIEGYLNGDLVGTEDFQLRARQDHDVNPMDSVFDAVDEVVISSVNRFAIDDLSFLG